MDFYLFQKINFFAGRWVCLDDSGIFFARYFGYFLIFFLFLFLALNFKKNWKMFAVAFISAILARLVIVNFIRLIWHRSRPFIENNVNLLLNYPDKASFPSGHAAFYFALSAAIYFYNKKIGILFFIGAFLISFARVFTGIHWPSDILAGALVGIFSSWLIVKIFKKF